MKRYPKGHFLALGAAIGIPFGLIFGLAMGNIGLGPALGVAMGLPIGVALEKKYNPHPLALTKEQIMRMRISAIVGLLFAVVLVFVILVLRH